MEHIDPRLLDALHMDEDFWRVGNPPVVVTTKSGSKYHVSSDGTMRGKMKGGTVDFEGQLHGSVYRAGGPIRVDAVVYGLRLEFRSGEELYYSSVVEIIEDEA